MKQNHICNLLLTKLDHHLPRLRPENTKLPGKGPYYGGSFDFGNNEPHCYTGNIPEGVPMLTHFVRVFAEYMRGAAPKGTDIEGWR